MPFAHFFRLLPLFGREHRVQLAPGPRDDRVESRLYRRPNLADASHLPVHDRVHPRLLRRGETEFPADPAANIRPRPTPVTITSVMITPVPSMEHVRHQYHAVERDPGNAPGDRRQEDDEGGHQW